MDPVWDAGLETSTGVAGFEDLPGVPDLDPTADPGFDGALGVAGLEPTAEPCLDSGSLSSLAVLGESGLCSTGVPSLGKGHLAFSSTGVTPLEPTGVTSLDPLPLAGFDSWGVAEGDLCSAFSENVICNEFKQKQKT